ncbi:MAG: serine acetyltransferase [Spirochaetales bacterium]|jgi:serine O-acetyltransferase|nr:serine acetyltransferase [Spirochaetales bacterium]
MINSDNFRSRLNKVVEELSLIPAGGEPGKGQPGGYPGARQMPQPEAINRAVDLLRAALFPGYFLNGETSRETASTGTGAALEQAMEILNEQIKRGFCFSCRDHSFEGRNLPCEEVEEITLSFLSRIPELRRLLIADALAAYRGDPAARSPEEAIFCYPSLRALTSHRIAHELFKLKVPILPRVISEEAHSHTGIDIHPGAEIGEYFFIDHGTGTVIGETCLIGSNVRIYQGVTLGAKSFPLDSQGAPIKGIPRHPIVEDDVIIYSGATILGRVTIGRGAEIGGNVWLTESVLPGARVVQHDFERTLQSKAAQDPVHSD